jgi:hypothetical protein
MTQFSELADALKSSSENVAEEQSVSPYIDKLLNKVYTVEKVIFIEKGIGKRY